MFPMLMSRVPAAVRMIEPLEDRFASLNLGTTLTLKLLGFIEAKHAEILDVEEGLLLLQIGDSGLSRWLRSSHPLPMRIRLTFSELDGSTINPDVDWHPGSRYSQVDVAIHPLGRGWTQERFQEQSRRLLWDLRAHLVAS